MINRSLAGVVREARSSGAFDRILGLCGGAEGALQDELVDLSAISDRALDGIAATPGAALGSSRRKLSDDDVEAFLKVLRARDARALLYIGGNDSADTLHRLADLAASRSYDLRSVAVPKTIDNDLPLTDHCPGYGSIARFCAVATMDSAKDTESMPAMYPVKFIEVMGRDAGWVSASAGLGRRSPEDAPHLIYMPEYPVSRQELLRDVERAYRTFGRVVAVVAETVRDETGAPFADASASGEHDPFGHPLLRGTADMMCRLVQSELGLRSRFDKPGSLQRMSTSLASPVDLAEAEEVGRAAVRAALAGENDVMVTIERDSDEPYRSHTGTAPLAAIANQQRLMPEAFVTGDHRSITPAFYRYALPLLGPDPLPHYARLSDVPRA